MNTFFVYSIYEYMHYIFMCIYKYIYIYVCICMYTYMSLFNYLGSLVSSKNTLLFWIYRKKKSSSDSLVILVAFFWSLLQCHRFSKLKPEPSPTLWEWAGVCCLLWTREAMKCFLMIGGFFVILLNQKAHRAGVCREACPAPCRLTPWLREKPIYTFFL